MENNINIDTYLTLSKEGLKETSEEASEEAIVNMGEKGEDHLDYPGLNWGTEELYFEDGELMISGELFYKGKELGYLSPTIPLGNETIIEIIDYYMKKMEKVKAVLEATK